jgi:hypothetical protein
MILVRLLNLRFLNERAASNDRNLKFAALQRISLEMNRAAVYPPHPEEGASTCASRKHNHRVAPVSKDGAATWFETPCTRPRNLGRSKIAAPHHEAGRDRECIKLIGIRLSACE